MNALSDAEREFASGLDLGNLIEAGAAAGLIGGALMAGWAVIAALVNGQGPFAPFALFGATFLGVEALLGGAGAVALGLALHLCMSVLLGVVFAAIVGRDPARSFAAFAGVLLRRRRAAGDDVPGHAGGRPGAARAHPDDARRLDHPARAVRAGRGLGAVAAPALPCALRSKRGWRRFSASTRARPRRRRGRRSDWPGSVVSGQSSVFRADY